MILSGMILSFIPPFPADIVAKSNYLDSPEDKLTLLDSQFQSIYYS